MDPVNKLWNVIVSGTIKAQLLEGVYAGRVVNPVIDDFYLRETAFAAKIFGTEWKLSGNDEFLHRSRLALNAIEQTLSGIDACYGVDEPTITPRGLRYRKGSIPATILLLYAAKDAASTIDDIFTYNDDSIAEYLGKCHIGSGRYYHDVITDRKVYSCPHIINTSAMTYYYYSCLARTGPTESNQAKQRINMIKNAIIDAQRADGFWPYVEPMRMQRIIFSIAPIMPSRILSFYNKLLGDYSIFFGDAVHHCITLYYLLLGIMSSRENLSVDEHNAVRRGWNFIEEKLIKYDDKHVRFDFSWEPRPKGYRHGNFIDTSTYFYVIDIIRLAQQTAIIKRDAANSYVNGIINHLLDKLVTNDGIIAAYEGSEKIIEKIMPRPSESIFDKGFFMSNHMLSRY